jgi:multiple sugar transport system permease protein
MEGNAAMAETALQGKKGISGRNARHARPGRKPSLMRNEAVAFYVLLAPWLIGFIVFTVLGSLFSLVMSFTQWDLFSPMKFIGWDNYLRMFVDTPRYFRDPVFFKSIGVTFLFTFMSVPVSLVASLILAVLMNVKVRGIPFFRTMFYLPSVVSGISVNMLWLWMFNSDYGLLNVILGKFGLPALSWLKDPVLVLPSLTLMGLWGAGGGAIIFLAGLKGIPVQLYEAASIDGAGIMKQFVKVTLPMLSPVILFNLIMGLIGSFQTFMSSFVMTAGGPDNMTAFVSLLIYNNAFVQRNMGYAAALSWVTLMIIAVFTVFIFRTSAKNVYYEAGK